MISASEGLQSRLPNTGTFEAVNIGKQGDAATRYLYTVDNRGVNIALEQTPVAENMLIKHTNLSEKASIGGEVWFTSNNSVTINAFSGRFGVGAGITDTQWANTIKTWQDIGYKVNAIPFKK